MTLEEAIEMLREELAELPPDTFEFNMGYAAAIRDLELLSAMFAFLTGSITRM